MSRATCPSPRCEQAVPVRPVGCCTGCEESYRFCRCGGGNRMLAGYCRLCGEALPVSPDRPHVDWMDGESTARTLGWVSLPRPFEVAHRQHVKGLRAAGGSWFSLPGGQVIGAAAPLDGGGTSVHQAALFSADEFDQRRELSLHPPQQIRLRCGSIQRPFIVCASLRRIAALAVEQSQQLHPLIDLSQQFDDQTTFVGSPLLLDDQLLLVTRQAGASGITLQLAQLRAGRVGGPTLSLSDRVSINTRCKQILGPVAAWEGAAALLSNDAVWLVHAEDGRIALRQFPLSQEPFFDQTHCYRPGNPRFCGGRLVVLGRDAQGTAFHEVLLRNGAPFVQRTDSGIPETEVAFAPYACDGQVQLIQIWGRKPHVQSLRGRRRALDHEATLDQLGVPQLTGDLLICRRLSLDGFELYKVVSGDPLLDLRTVGRLALPPGMRAISDVLVGAHGCDVLALDAQDPHKVGVIRMRAIQEAAA